MLRKLSIAGFALLIPLTSNASEIKQRPLIFFSGITLVQETDAFVVCSNCPDDHLSILPAPPKLVLRMSMNEPRPVQPVTGNSEVSPKSSLVMGDVSCLACTVHFGFDSAEITEKERSRLDELIRNIPTGTVANLRGYTCDLGSTAHNMSLSLTRARDVASYLKEKGISVGKVEGLGKCCPVSNDKQLNRRVEIITQKKEEQ